MTTVRLNPDDLKPEAEETVEGKIPVVLSLCAYDIPHSVSVRREEPHGPIEIRFEYPDKEEDDIRRVDNSLAVILGKHSGKVLGFTVTGLRPKDITVRVVQGVDAQIRQATRDNQRLNYKVIRRVVTDKLEPLLAGA
jgi:hypothetical protein